MPSGSSIQTLRQRLLSKTQQSDADLAESGLIVVRTLGSRGARVWLPGERHAAFVPTVPIQKVRSPVGAGDAFRGGFLYALERGFSPVEAAQWGAVAAGRKWPAQALRTTNSHRRLLSSILINGLGNNRENNAFAHKMMNPREKGTMTMSRRFVIRISTNGEKSMPRNVGSTRRMGRINGSRSTASV